MGYPGVLGIWGEWLFVFRELGGGALVVILAELGRKLIVLGIEGALPKRKSLHFV